MQIKVISVDVPQTVNKGKSTWQSMDVSYKNLETGKVAGKTLVSFKYPEVFSFFKNLGPNTQVNVLLVKEGDFWQWTRAELSSGDVVPNDPIPTRSAAPAPATKYSSNYETPEERKWKQRLIVRQASLNAAIATLKVDKTALASEQVMLVAAQYETWVYRDQVIQEIIDMPNSPEVF